MKKIIVLFLSSMLVLFLVSCGSSSTPAPAATTEKKMENRQTVDAFGTIQVRNIESINLDFPATVEEVAVTENQRVKSGDLLFKLNLEDYDNQIKNKELELNATLKNVARLKKDIQTKTKSVNDDTSNISKLSNDLAKLINDLKNAQGLYKKAQDELKEKTELFHVGTLPQSEINEYQKLVASREKDIDDINFAIKTAKLSIDQEKERITQSNKQFVKTKNNEIEQLNVSLDQDILKAATLQSDISLMKSKLIKRFIKQNSIISDMNNGVVYEIGYTAGDIVNSAKKLLTIADLSSVYVKAEVSEDFIKDVKTGSNVTIVPVADSSKKYTGKVTSIANKAFDKNGDTLIAVDIAVDNTDELLLPGFNVNVSIDIK